MIWSFAFQVSLDGGTLQTHSYDGVFGCCNAYKGPAYNFNFFDVQNLSGGDHILDIVLLDTDFGNRPYNRTYTTSNLLFDYAVVTDSSSTGSHSQ